jgi:hypothetical protein
MPPDQQPAGDSLLTRASICAKPTSADASDFSFLHQARSIVLTTDLLHSRLSAPWIDLHSIKYLSAPHALDIGVYNFFLLFFASLFSLLSLPPSSLKSTLCCS